MIRDSAIKSTFSLNKKIYIISILSFFISFYFLYYAFFGQKGVLTYFSLKRDMEEMNIINNYLEKEEKDKQKLVDGMRLESLDMDLLSEQIKKKLGYADKDEIVIYKK